MTNRGIYLVAVIGELRVPIIKVVRNEASLDHVVIDRASTHGCKTTYHGSGHLHFADPGRLPDWKGESRVYAAQLLGYKHAERQAFYIGPCSREQPVIGMRWPQRIDCYVYRRPYRFLDEKIYSRKVPKHAVEMALSLSDDEIGIETWLCPPSKEDFLSRWFETVVMYRETDPMVAFCRNATGEMPRHWIVFPDGRREPR